jgi:excisionase family DNA binding protein
VRNTPISGNEPDDAVPEHIIALTLDQACKRLQLSRPSVVGLIESSRLHAVKVGRKWRVSVSSLDHFVNGEVAK